jgi:hypothetical protein
MFFSKNHAIKPCPPQGRQNNVRHPHVHLHPERGIGKRGEGREMEMGLGLEEKDCYRK